MQHLQELIIAYTAMSPWARSLLRDIANDYAALYPAPKKQPALSLVTGDRINVQAPPDLLDNSIDSSAPVTIRKPVDRK